MKKKYFNKRCLDNDCDVCPLKNSKTLCKCTLLSREFQTHSIRYVIEKLKREIEKVECSKPGNEKLKIKVKVFDLIKEKEVNVGDDILYIDTYDHYLNKVNDEEYRDDIILTENEWNFLKEILEG